MTPRSIVQRSRSQGFDMYSIKKCNNSALDDRINFVLEDNVRATRQLAGLQLTGLTVWNSLPDSLRDPSVESKRLGEGLENASLCRASET